MSSVEQYDLVLNNDVLYFFKLQNKILPMLKEINFKYYSLNVGNPKQTER